MIAVTFKPVVPKFFADDSCFEPENTSTLLPNLTSVKPELSSAHSHSASSRAPAIHPDHRSMSSFELCGTSMATTMSPI